MKVLIVDDLTGASNTSEQRGMFLVLHRWYLAYCRLTEMFSIVVCLKGEERSFAAQHGTPQQVQRH